MVVIVDYGVGNLFSLKSSFSAIGADAVVSSSPDEIRRADKIILPGVGAFEDAAGKLQALGLDKLLCELAEQGKYIMGICLGMQLLFDESLEYGSHKGLSLIDGTVKPIKDVIPEEYKIPHIGWNKLEFTGEKSPIFSKINEGDFVYFVHSFYVADCEKNTIATAEYGAKITAAVQNKNVFGCQFHPEKSGQTGLKILSAFCELE